MIQNAAASALGQVVIQLAREMGLKTINVVRRESQKAELLALGATEVIPADDLVERVREVTPEGPRYALDAVGGKQGWELLRTLRAGGMIVLHGSLAHPETMPLNNGLVLTRSLTIRGFWLTEWRRRASRRKQKEIVTTILGLMANGALILPSVRTFPLSAVVEAVAASEQGEGKVILTS